MHLLAISGLNQSLTERETHSLSEKHIHLEVRNSFNYHLLFKFFHGLILYSLEYQNKTAF